MLWPRRPVLLTRDGFSNSSGVEDMFHKSLSIAGVLGLCCATMARSAEPQQAPRDWLNYFSENWREGDWQQKGRSQPAGYMRPQEDTAWQARMRAMQGCVQQRDGAIPLLLETLRTGDTPQRVLAAQMLGYLGSKVPAEPLVAALKSEADPAVRLYLVDTLGMLGKGGSVDWDEYLKNESNRDVKRHVGYADERNGKPLDARVVEELKHWDVRHIDSATIGQPAPDFALLSAQGDTVRLSDFRGKKAVVLVFIYGDT
jgi:hypothetical protein